MQRFKDLMRTVAMGVQLSTNFNRTRLEAPQCPSSCLVLAAKIFMEYRIFPNKQLGRLLKFALLEGRLFE